MEPFSYFVAPVADPKAQTAIFGVGLLMMLDLLVGIIGAVVTHTFSSEKMREGLLHKFTELACIALAVIFDGWLQCGLKLTVEPVLIGTCIYISIMEAGSVLELVRKYNPDAEGLIGWLTQFVQPKGDIMRADK